jgi:hypothetical protein
MVRGKTLRSEAEKAVPYSVRDDGVFDIARFRFIQGTFFGGNSDRENGAAERMKMPP